MACVRKRRDGSVARLNARSVEDPAFVEIVSREVAERRQATLSALAGLPIDLGKPRHP